MTNTPKLFSLVIGGFITLATPVLLVLISVRIVMSPLFLQVEYTRPGFPIDRYGFTTEERLYYGTYAVTYLLNDADISFLGDLTFPNGQALFNERELHHMHDVKILTQAAFQVLFLGVLIMIALSIGLWRWARPILWRNLFHGGVLTITLIITIVVSALVAWDFFFVTFHQLFFADGTWSFPYSDTLIRLFPEQLWFDAAITIGIFTTTGAVILILISWRQGAYRFQNRQR
ncbi:MAG: TIGR01906 family membrane protein [Anaerolineae bacterium]|jgi:integral membrane protein (TIGR01906 family)|nr:TIGR01906 family membrane protein [Anaerolineae bacterium]